MLRFIHSGKHIPYLEQYAIVVYRILNFDVQELKSDILGSGYSRIHLNHFKKQLAIQIMETLFRKLQLYLKNLHASIKAGNGNFRSTKYRGWKIEGGMKVKAMISAALK